MRELVRIRVFAAAIGLLLVCHASSLADGEAEAVIAEIKRVVGANRSGYSVTFCARPPAVRDKSAVGHAFVLLAYEDAEKQASVQRALGFFPKNGSGVFSTVEGELIDDFNKNAGKGPGVVRFTVHIGDEIGKKVEKEIENWQKRPYNLADENCIAFTIAVAKIVKLKTPEKEGLLPIMYMRKLAEMNRN